MTKIMPNDRIFEISGNLSKILNYDNFEKTICIVRNRFINLFGEEIMSRIPLLVDNAHGAYLAFLEDSLHPIKLGAAMCCDSAHKTLPVLTGGAYLHISTRYKERYLEVVKRGLAIFGSTSPSYLILQSLDLCNKYLSESYNKKLAACISDVNRIKKYMQDKKIPVKDTEPLKIVIDTASAGYTGTSTSNGEKSRNIFQCGADGPGCTCF